MKFPDMVHSLKPNPKNHIQASTDSCTVADLSKQAGVRVLHLRQAVCACGSRALSCRLVECAA